MPGYCCWARDAGPFPRELCVSPALASGNSLVEIARVKNYRSIFLLAAVVGFAIATSAQTKPGWLSDYKKAQQEAKANNKLVLLDFTGSDWCGWCMKLNREVFSQPQFKDYASKALVLLEVDFPRQREQSAETRKQNQELAQQYQVEGFPTIVVVNGDGRKLWQYDGYFADGLAAFIAQLEKLRKG
jgi:thioredoxin-related protein